MRILKLFVFAIFVAMLYTNAFAAACYGEFCYEVVDAPNQGNCSNCVKVIYQWQGGGWEDCPASPVCSNCNCGPGTQIETDYNGRTGCQDFVSPPMQISQCVPCPSGSYSATGSSCSSCANGYPDSDGSRSSPYDCYKCGGSDGIGTYDGGKAYYS